MDKFELKECPLCGNKPYFECSSTGQKVNSYTKGYRIACHRCGLYTTSATVEFDYSPSSGMFVNANELEDLVLKWNTRQ